MAGLWIDSAQALPWPVMLRTIGTTPAAISCRDSVSDQQPKCALFSARPEVARPLWSTAAMHATTADSPGASA